MSGVYNGNVVGVGRERGWFVIEGVEEDKVKIVGWEVMVGMG